MRMKYDPQKLIIIVKLYQYEQNNKNGHLFDSNYL